MYALDALRSNGTMGPAGSSQWNSNEGEQVTMDMLLQSSVKEWQKLKDVDLPESRIIYNSISKVSVLHFLWWGYHNKCRDVRCQRLRKKMLQRRSVKEICILNAQRKGKKTGGPEPAPPGGPEPAPTSETAEPRPDPPQVPAVEPVSGPCDDVNDRRDNESVDCKKLRKKMLPDALNELIKLAAHSGLSWKNVAGNDNVAGNANVAETLRATVNPIPRGSIGVIVGIKNSRSDKVAYSTWNI